MGNDNSKERRGPKIESWETLDTIVDHKDFFGKMDFGLKVAIEQPIAEGGRRLYKRLNAEIRFGRHFIRLNTKAFTSLLKILDEHREAIDAAVETIHAENDEMRREEQERREKPRSDGPGAKRPGGPGGGLGQFKDPNAEGKTARKRRQKRERGEGKSQEG